MLRQEAGLASFCRTSKSPLVNSKEHPCQLRQRTKQRLSLAETLRTHQDITSPSSVDVFTREDVRNLFWTV